MLHKGNACEPEPGSRLQLHLGPTDILICRILANNGINFADIMSTDYTDTLNVAEEINRTLSSGQDINSEQLGRLMDAYNKDGIKNDKVDSMIVATISNAIDCTLKDCGYEYKYEFKGYSAYLRVCISQKRKVEFEISKANLPKVLPVLKSTIDALSLLQSQAGDFSVIPYTDINMI